jgi:tungstate transport system substrate-binding protein
VARARYTLLCVSVVCVIGLAACRKPPPAAVLVVATTTSVGNSGLLDALARAFQQQHGLELRSHLVGSGRALRMLEDDHADLVISHAPDAEAAALKRHPEWRYRKIMFNEFVIVGPERDPARLKAASGVRDAMRRIASSEVRFISRGDQSGTHEREEALWRMASARPPADRLIVAGAGMGTTLRIASETAAYTLTDRATLAQLADSVRLSVVFDADAALLNTYSVIYDSAGSKAGDAKTFFDWISAGAGRHAIAEYHIKGTPAFIPWPPERDANHPHARPR